MPEDYGPHPHSGPPTSASVYGYVGARLRELRTAHGLTQAQVAAIISVSPQQYQKYEDAQSKCSLPYLLRLAGHYGVHVNDLLPVDPPMPEPEADDPLADEADMLSRLVSAFVRIDDRAGKLRLVQLVEALVNSQTRTNPGGGDGGAS